MKSPELNASHENNERCVERYARKARRSTHAVRALRTRGFKRARSAERELSRHGLRVDVVEVLSTAHVARSSLVVAVGGDGTFLQATHKFAEGVTVPILGVNSSPSSSVGFFCVCNETSFADVIREWLEGRTTLCVVARRRATMAAAHGLARAVLASIACGSLSTGSRMACWRRMTCYSLRTRPPPRQSTASSFRVARSSSAALACG